LRHNIELDPLNLLVPVSLVSVLMSNQHIGPESEYFRLAGRGRARLGDLKFRIELHLITLVLLHLHSGVVSLVNWTEATFLLILKLHSVLVAGPRIGRRGRLAILAVN